MPRLIAAVIEKYEEVSSKERMQAGATKMSRIAKNSQIYTFRVNWCPGSEGGKTSVVPQNLA